MDRDAAFRAAAFGRLRALAPDGGPIPWSLIDQGFQHEGSTHLFAGQALGIFAPKAMGRILSIKTVHPKPARLGKGKFWYDDQKKQHEDLLANGETLRYAMQGKDPGNRHNRLLADAHANALPLIYFVGVAPAVYTALFPVYIVGLDTKALMVDVAVAASSFDTAPGFAEPTAPPPPDADTRRYTTRQAKQRLHQGRFRTAVLEAYQGRCALSGLPETRLLDAAHIVPDSDIDLGQPVVPNGLAMSRLHHAAYDAGLLGIDPTGRVHISRSLLDQQDGPILHALQALDGQRLRAPIHPRHAPDPARLEQRFALFQHA